MTKTSRFNYIKRGLVGVCAATMLTGLCAGSAFGALSADNTATESGSGSSTVTIKSDLQVSATVPTSIPVMLDTDGFTTPTNMIIENTTLGYGIQLKSAQITEKTDNSFTIEETGTGDLANNQLRLTLQKGTDTGTKTTLKSAAAVDLNWDIAGATAADAPGTVPLTLTIDKGQLTKDFFDNYTTQKDAFKIAWTVGF